MQSQANISFTYKSKLDYLNFLVFRIPYIITNKVMVIFAIITQFFALINEFLMGTKKTITLKCN